MNLRDFIADSLTSVKVTHVDIKETRDDDNGSYLRVIVYYDRVTGDPDPEEMLDLSLRVREAFPSTGFPVITYLDRLDAPHLHAAE